MGRRTVRMLTFTPTAVGNTTNITDGTYLGLVQGSGTTSIARVWEISINGQAASSSSPTPMILARDSTAAATLGAPTNSDTLMDSSGSTAAQNTGNAWTTKPQRSATLQLLSCALNAFGGSFFWRANRVEECPAIVGQAVNTGEMSLSCFTGGTPGAVDSHYIYEPA